MRLSVAFSVALVALGCEQPVAGPAPVPSAAASAATAPPGEVRPAAEPAFRLDALDEGKLRQRVTALGWTVFAAGKSPVENGQWSLKVNAGRERDGLESSTVLRCGGKPAQRWSGSAWYAQGDCVLGVDAKLKGRPSEPDARALLEALLAGK